MHPKLHIDDLLLQGAHLLLGAALTAGCAHAPAWSEPQTSQLAELRLAESPLPPDPSNRFADDEVWS